MSTISGFGIGPNKFFGTLPINPSNLFSVLPDAAAARGLQSAARASAAAARNRPVDTETRQLQSAARTAKSEAQDLGRITGRLDRVVKTVEKALERLVDIKTNISDMRRQVVTARSTSISDNERHVFADRFDQFLGKLNLRVKTAGFFGTNLIGTSIRDSFEPDEITFQTKPDSLVKKTISGLFSGSDFFISDASGDNFYPDIFGSLLTKFPNPDDETGEIVSSDDTVVFNEDTGALSITRPGAGTPFLDGTVTRKGLGVLHTFLYNDFEDDTSLDRALSDVDNASAKIRFNIGFLKGELAKASAAQSFVEGQIKSKNKFAASVEAQAFGDERRAALEAERRDILFSAAFQGSVGFNRQGGLFKLTAPSIFDFSV